MYSKDQENKEELHEPTTSTLLEDNNYRGNFQEK